MAKAKTNTAALPDDRPLPEALVKVIKGLTLASEPLGSDVPGYLSTQCAFLDYCIGRPGLPIGRLTTIFGKEGSLKSTTVYHTLVETQRRGGIAILADSERRFSRDRGERLGLDLNTLVMAEGRTVEDVFKAIEEAALKIRERDVEIPVTIALDSLAGMPSKDAIEGDIDGVRMAQVARFVSGVFPRILPLFGAMNITLIVTNQTRSYIDTNGPRRSGVRKVMGNRAMIAEASLVFWSTVMINLTSTGIVGDDDDPEGIEVRAVVKKNSVGPEGRRCEYIAHRLYGIDNAASKLDLLVHLGIIKQTSGWYSYEGREKKFQKGDFAAVLEEHPELDQLVHEAPELWVRGG